MNCPNCQTTNPEGARFYLNCAAPLKAPSKLRCVNPAPISESLASFDLLPTIDWAHGIARVWTPGETAALKQLQYFERKAGD